ncbi:MAG TPA: hypothetical protein VMU07_01260 [Candidatus Paceibacterota bacterium]|nr:hypothetical protein [Candidatus Paceibacterota bacterium]
MDDVPVQPRLLEALKTTVCQFCEEKDGNHAVWCRKINSKLIYAFAIARDWKAVKIGDQMRLHSMGVTYHDR